MHLGVWWYMAMWRLHDRYYDFFGPVSSVLGLAVIIVYILVLLPGPGPPILTQL